MVDVSIFDRAVILTGPTGSGKSQLACLLAERFGAEIISMDSMTLYRALDIGTAKPLNDLERVPHLLMNCLDPWESASVAWWLAEAAKITSEVLNRGKIPLFVGGTPLYLKALVFGIFEAPPIDPAIRAELESLSADELHRQLKPVDPQAASRIHPNDHKRLVRALEVYRQHGEPLSSYQQQFSRQPRTRQIPVMCLELPRDVLYERINCRVDAMMQAGWLEEVRSLLKLPRPLSRVASQAAGYRELIAHLRGECTLEQAITATKTRSRQLAKRQLTWFRHFPGLEMLSIEAVECRLKAYLSF